MRDFGTEPIRRAFVVVLGFLVISPLVFVVPKLVPFIISAGLLYFGLAQLKSYKSLSKWIQVQGRLIATDMGVYGQRESQYGPPTKYYFPIAHFSYEFNGKNYTNNRYAFDRKSVWSTNKENVENTVKELSKEQRVQVFVNPITPEQSALNTVVSARRKSGSQALVVSAILICVLGGYLVFNI